MVVLWRAAQPLTPSPGCPAQVEAIESKYGINLAQQATEGVKLIYGTFVEALIPPGEQPSGAGRGGEGRGSYPWGWVGALAEVLALGGWGALRTHDRDVRGNGE